MLLNSHISAYARCLPGKVCGLVRSTWGISLGLEIGYLIQRYRAGDAPGACWANIPPMAHGYLRNNARLAVGYFFEGGGGAFDAALAVSLFSEIFDVLW